VTESGSRNWRWRWEVWKLIEGDHFAWVARGPGVLTSASHRVTGTSNGTIAMSTIDQDCPLGWLIGIAPAKITNRYLILEGESLKKFVENA
jgi:hypothetical protein